MGADAKPRSALSSASVFLTATICPKAPPRARDGKRSARGIARRLPGSGSREHGASCLLICLSAGCTAPRRRSLAWAPSDRRWRRPFSRAVAAAWSRASAVGTAAVLTTPARGAAVALIAHRVARAWADWRRVAPKAVRPIRPAQACSIDSLWPFGIGPDGWRKRADARCGGSPSLRGRRHRSGRWRSCSGRR